MGLASIDLVSGVSMALMFLLYRQETPLKKRSPILVAFFLLGTATLDICGVFILYNLGRSHVCGAATFFYDVGAFLIVVPFTLRGVRFYFVFKGSKIAVVEGETRLKDMNAHSSSFTKTRASLIGLQVGKEQHFGRRMKWLSRAKENWWVKLFLIIFSIAMLFNIISALTPHPGERCEDNDRIHSAFSLIAYSILWTFFAVTTFIFLYLLRHVRDVFSVSNELRAVGILYMFYALFMFLANFFNAAFLIVSCLITFAVQFITGWRAFVQCLRGRGVRRESRKRSVMAGMMGTRLLMGSVGEDGDLDSFNEVLSSEEGVKVFRDFLALEWSAENLMFYEEVVVVYEKTNPMHRHSLAKSIADRYIRVGSEMEINIPGDARDKCISILEEDPSSLDVTVFDCIKEHVLLTLRRDSFPRFQNHDIYKQWKSQRDHDRDTIHRARDANLI
jgi:hypothetical protein